MRAICLTKKRDPYYKAVAFTSGHKAARKLGVALEVAHGDAARESDF